MNAALWPAVREYITAEVRLAILRARIEERRGQSMAHERKEISELEEQVTRMETAVREGLAEGTES